jgi:glycosyltransferase involved in cell wall biosynthesis
VFGSIGRLYWIKNQEALVRAFATATSDEPDAVLLLVGGGDDTEIRALAGSLGIGDRVLLAPRRGDVPELLAAMDVFVHPALAESFGMVIVEAMAMGLPIVSTPVGIAPEALSEGVGVLARNGSVEGLEEALAAILDRRESWPTMSREAGRRAQAFRADQMVKAYEALYLSALHLR